MRHLDFDVTRPNERRGVNIVSQLDGERNNRLTRCMELAIFYVSNSQGICRDMSIKQSVEKQSDLKLQVQSCPV